MLSTDWTHVTGPYCDNCFMQTFLALSFTNCQHHPLLARTANKSIITVWLISYDKQLCPATFLQSPTVSSDYFWHALWITMHPLRQARQAMESPKIPITKIRHFLFLKRSHTCLLSLLVLTHSVLWHLDCRKLPGFFRLNRQIIHTQRSDDPALHIACFFFYLRSVTHE